MAFLHLFIVSDWVFISSVIKGLFLRFFLDAVSSWSSARLHGIDFYFFLNSGFLRVRPANWNGEGLSYIFFPREEFPFRVHPAEGWAWIHPGFFSGRGY